MNRWALLLTTLWLLVLLASAAPASAQEGAGAVATGWSAPLELVGTSISENGGQSAIVCDPGQNLHIFWGGILDERGYVFYQNDASGEVSRAVDIIATNDVKVDHPAVAVSARDNTLHLIWASAYTGGKLYYSTAPLDRASDPKAWTTPIILHRNISSVSGSIVVDPAGTIHIVYGRSEDEGQQLLVDYIRSDDGGQRWSIPVSVASLVVPTPSEVYGKLAIDGKGRMHVGVTARSYEYGIRSEVGYVQSTDGGQTWSAYERVGEVSPGPAGVAYMGVYAFGDDEIHRTWHDYQNRMHQYSLDGGQTWSKPEIMVTMGAAFGGYNNLTRDSGDTIHAITGVKEGFYSLTYQNGGWTPPATVDDRDLDPHVWTIAACGGNRLHATYNSFNIGDQEVFYFTRQVAAPSIPRQPIPASTLGAADLTPLTPPWPTPPGTGFPTREGGEATPPPAQEGEVAAEAAVSPAAVSTQPPAAMPSAMTTVAIALLPALALIAGVFLWRRR
jgi:hypothetical protein